MNSYITDDTIENLKAMAHRGLSGPQAAATLFLPLNTIKTIAFRHGFRFNSRRGRPSNLNRKRKKPGKGLSGSEFYKAKRRIPDDPFLARQVKTID